MKKNWCILMNLNEMHLFTNFFGHPLTTITSIHHELWQYLNYFHYLQFFEKLLVHYVEFLKK